MHDELTNILIVDDEPANLLVLETVLADPGYRLVRAQSASQALLALMAQEFAVMVLDVRLPDMNGFELAQMVKERKKTAHLPIIFLTAYFDEDQHRLQGYGTGAVDYLHKPVNPDVLRSKVSVFAELDRKTREVQRANQALRELNETLERRVTERSEALLAADRRLQAMMASITDGLLLVERDGRIGYVNEQGARLLGRRADELGGQPASDGLGGPEFAAGFERALASGQAVSFEAQAAGGERWLQCHCYPSPDGLSVYFHDITDRRELQLRREQLLAAEQAARGAADQAARAKEELLAAISHELRTPLAAIIGWVNVLAHPGVQPGMLQRGMQAIARNAQAQSVLVDDLLEMSRIVAGKQLMNVQRVDLNAQVAAAADTARPTALARELSIELHLAAEPAEVYGDAGRLTQIVMNLVTNAMKFTPAGGAVTLRTVVTDSDVELHVSDTGQGIAPDFLPRLFDRFTQADAEASRVHGGLGLGLSIVKNLVEQHGGTVSAHSSGLEQGAVFSVRLPRAARSLLQQSEGSDDDAPDADITGLRVLLVDDHADVLEAHARLLAGRGAEVVTAESGEAALALLREQSFDVLLSDLGMPGMGGYELIRLVREQLGLAPDQLGAAAVTAYVRQADCDAALQAGFQRCLHKTASPRLLARTVAELAPSRRQRQAAGAPLRTLFVEDNPDLREQISWLLQELGLQLQTCATAEEALAVSAAQAFDLVITDVSLPGMSGVDLARALLLQRPDAWVVFSSGYAMGSDLGSFGPNVRALLKPFELSDVERLVAEVRRQQAGGGR
ncbi:response regulator [Roseateles asaccharophilus]|uniref:histidine kinase n=1 Tax=Roseateles asaccharophilus TaxID=582607 RepID=A0ABU2A529_9BURK|nr:response regulator [Roseateles asaccharophilus]MDR7332251.1 PAS domain S-box-containing protein [Roseateles asaccharophilus]